MCGKLRREGGRRERFHFIIQDLDIFLRGYSCRIVSKIKDGTGNSTRLLLPTAPLHMFFPSFSLFSLSPHPLP